MAERYEDLADWLLCLGIAIFLGARLPMRNPEGHSPRYWKKHPGSKRPTPTPSTTPPLRNQADSAWLRSWLVLDEPAEPSNKKTFEAVSLAQNVLLAFVFAVVTMPVVWKWSGWWLCWTLFIFIVLKGFSPANRLPRKTLIVATVVLELAFFAVFARTARSQWAEEMASAMDGYIHSKTIGSGPLGLLIGETGGPLEWKPDDALRLFPDTSLKIEKGADGIEFSTTVHDKNGNVVVTIDKNHWHVTSFCLDKNYSDDSLEVKDSRGRVVLQVVLFPTEVQLQGEYHNGLGQGVRIGQSPKGSEGGGSIEMWNTPEQERRIEEDHLISPMFRYPSKDHWGEKENENVRSTERIPFDLTTVQRAASLSIFPRVNNLAIPAPFKVGDDLKVSYEFTNSGSDEASHYKRFARAYLEYGDPKSPDTVNRAWSEFVNWRSTIEPVQPAEESISTGARGLFSDTQGFYSKITKKSLSDIGLGEAHIFLTVAISYEDKTGSFVQEGCFWAKEPAGPASPWAPCGTHGSRVLQQTKQP